MLSSRESFLNGFELHLDDDIDAVAVESFWAFVSGGSPLLSAFEWILMLHHMGKLARDEKLHFDASAGIEEGTVPNFELEIPASVIAVGGKEDGSPGNSSGAITFGYSNEDDDSNGLEGANVDARDAVSFDIDGDGADAGPAFAATLSELHVEDSFYDSDALNHAPASARDNSCAAHEGAAVACGGVGLIAVLNAAQRESCDALLTSVDDSQSVGGIEDATGAASAAMIEDRLLADIEEGQGNVTLGQDGERALLPMEARADTEACTGGSCKGEAELLTPDALAASAPTGMLHAGCVAHSESWFDSSASRSRDVPSRVNSVALCALAQVMPSCLCSTPRSFCA